jgi:hypothetical protein
MLSRECDDHKAPSYIRNLLLYGRIFYHHQSLLQLRMSRSYNGLVFENTYLEVLLFITIFLLRRHGMRRP